MMTRSKLFWVATTTAVACFVLNGRVAAHHGYDANYDLAKPQTVTGVIQTVRYANPHVKMQLQTTKNPKQWTIVLPSPSKAQKQGLTQSFLKVGSTATVVGWPAINGNQEMGAERVTIGKKTVVLDLIP